MDILDLADRSWPLLTRLADVHAGVYRATRGRVGHRVPGGAPMLLLEHTGARSGQPRVTPLIYTRDGDALVIVASKGGFPRHPAWYHNLRAHPDTAVQVGRQRRHVRARVAAVAERERLWDLAIATYGPYRDYRARAGRDVPLIVLEPR